MTCKIILTFNRPHPLSPEGFFGTAIAGTEIDSRGVTPSEATVLFPVAALESEAIELTPVEAASEATRVCLSASPEDVDATIDRLRGRGVSIRGVQKRRLNLEQTFIDLVRKEQA